MKGRLYWITGLSGAGKTTIASSFYKIKKQSKDNIVFLDGDVLRATLAEDLGYSREERMLAAKRYSKMCKLLVDQGIDVIIATISMFHEVRAWNRENVENYIEVYIKVPLEVLEQRNQKKLYSGVKDNKVNNVVGVDLILEEPSYPDLVILNDGSWTVAECANMILQL